jgi:signal transduction histidine kinase
VTHELRNPLHVIFGTLEMVDAAGPGHEIGPDDLRAIQRAARRINDLAEDILAIGSIEACADDLRLEPVWLPSLWREIRAECEAMPRPPGWRSISRRTRQT